MTSIRAIIIDPATRTVRQEYVPNTLKAFQGIVGGLIEHVDLRPVEAECYCNEEGKLKDNSYFIFRGREHDPFAGPVIIFGGYDSDGNETSATWSPEEIEEFVTWGDKLTW